MADNTELSLSSLSPAQPRRSRKRVGRGLGSGKGRYSGRGIKGQKSRAGSHQMRAGFEGGQMPIYMRLGKQRGSTSKDAMPIGPHRTATQPVNLRDLERLFPAGTSIALEDMLEKGLVGNLRVDVKVLGDGELTKPLSVTAHRFSASARAKIEAAGGTVVQLRELAEVPAPRERAAVAAVEAAPESVSGGEPAEPAGEVAAAAGDDVSGADGES